MSSASSNGQPVREWVTFPDPRDDSRRWQVDVTFLSSSWQCVFNNGCQGVLTEPAPEMVQGCCSYGAHFSDRADRRRVERFVKHLTDDDWQFRRQGLARGVVARAAGGAFRTRLVDDACIFLNRPGFALGPGCALHAFALRTGRPITETKPDVCWQLPLRRIDREEDDGSVTSMLTEFAREGWGDGGAEFAWWCTEAPEAFTATQPVFRTLEVELRAMVGDVLYDEIARYLDARRASTVPPAPHPAAIPVRRRRAPIRGSR